ncbi:MAG: HlyD family efflux transporter periplasmic adaptor subunit [Candidatus Andeanibacterium colombiense]|uniref:HlyD family efflux transporter periplasmic adaptor subunit n=1 Tax=Candidatus Andeanibacterium colombiense TaxID=3121345 RepID=A0AAJ5X6C8_9SPHN|nr:MAG: HlyD family efflux transporter periplasmic adaptor subunit [Sphingomonadaceae bacterium]
MATLTETPETLPDTGKTATRKRLFLIFGVVLAVIAAVVLIWQLGFAWRSVSTDNAYVGADTAQITPLVGAPVAQVLVEDTARVKKGDILVRLDDSDARIALDQAEANLARAERGFRQTSASGQALLAQAQARGSDIQAARAQLSVAQANYERAKVDYDRRHTLSATGAVSGDELTSATNALRSAQANLDVARAQVAQAQATQRSASQEADATLALTRGTTESTSPEVLAARAARDQAKLDLDRTVLRAPFDGVIAQRKVQVGQRVAAGAVLMTVVPIDRLYVDANFKEGQLKRVRTGQPVELTSDLYGGSVTYHGRVIGLSGGTGSAFALIPAQNATGNWIKVVQRLPVRVALDPKELAQHPLRVGLSMDATIDVTK